MGELELRTAEALAILQAARPQIAGVSSEVGTQADVAYLRLSKGDSPHRWGVVSSPGDRWFSLEVDGGFSNNFFQEDTPDDEARQILVRLVGFAVEYILHEPTPARRGRLGVYSIELSTSEGKLSLQKSLAGQLADVATNIVRPNR